MKYRACEPSPTQTTPFVGCSSAQVNGAPPLLRRGHRADVEPVAGSGFDQRGGQATPLDQIRVEAHTQRRRRLAHD